MGRKKHMHVTATLTNGTVRDTAPLIYIQKIKKGRGQLNVSLPKDIVFANRANQLNPLDYHWAELGRFCKIKHVVSLFCYVSSHLRLNLANLKISPYPFHGAYAAHCNRIGSFESIDFVTTKPLRTIHQYLHTYLCRFISKSTLGRRVERQL